MNMKILIINGPNLNLLGSREPSIYGTMELHDLVNSIKKYGDRLGIQVQHIQSNSEGCLIDAIHNSVGLYDGIVLNAGAYSHYSYALRDAIAGINVPVIEVHITNIYNREDFRNVSVISPVCIGQISGLGIDGYKLALQYFFDRKANEHC
jgi:3-dehydroquinate dehydratase II